METYGNLWQLMATFTIFWQRMATYGNLWQFVVTCGNLWQLVATFGSFWKLLATLAIFGNLCAILQHLNFVYRPAGLASCMDQLLKDSSRKGLNSSLQSDHNPMSGGSLPTKFGGKK